MSTQDEDEFELLLDVSGLPPQAKITEIVTSIAAGALIVLYSASELLEEIRRWRSSQRTSSNVRPFH